ncbi:hypothetical protein NM688_g4175 [Phlebia brevispora]|uniref:Uncharacterized protein n=1 Tax=Phlebia brevispora TaxID=194682 RepID=A0ACC1T3V1_9APHY|nr:hypothetical protein NM688_g4175 [Phlebia brevispora]
MPRLLSDSTFVQLVEAHAEEQERKEREAQVRKQAREEYSEVLNRWRAEEDKRKRQNEEICRKYKVELADWNAERKLAREEGRKPRWAKPTLMDKMLKGIPKPVKVVEDEGDEEWVDIDEGSSSDDER